MLYVSKSLSKLFLCAVAALLFASCAHSIYPVESLYNNYDLRMRSVDDLAIKGKVQVYFNERDIKGEYTIISANTYSPFCFLPIKAIREKKMSKRFLAESVKKAYEEGGNAVLVKSVGYFFVLNLKDWNADDAPAAVFVNPIFKMENAERIQDPALADMKRGERTRIEKAFIDEIKDNCDNLTDLEEVAVVREKIQILSNYNLRQKHQKSSIEKAVKKATKKVNRAEKKINKQADKLRKAAEKASSANKK